MHKYLKIIAIFIVLLSAIYSGLWLFNKNRIKLFAESLIENNIKKIGGEDSKFYYSRSIIGGFPFSYKITISNPQFVFRDEGIFFDVASQGDMVFSSNITATDFSVKLPKRFYIKNRYAEDGKSPAIVNYNSAPSLEIKAFPQEMKTLLLNVARGDFDKIRVTVSKLSYEDSGFVIYNGDINGEVVSSSKGIKVFFNEELQNNQSSVAVKAVLKDLDIDRFATKIYGDQGSGKINVDAEAQFVEDADYQYILDVSKFSLSSGLFSINADASIKKKPDVSFPQGGINIKLSNYSNFVDFQIGLMNFLSEHSAMPVSKVDSGRADRIKDFLLDVATEKSSDNKDILITIVRKPDQEPRVGGLSFGEVMSIFKSNFSQKSS